MVDPANISPEVIEAFAKIQSKELRFAIAKVDGAVVVLESTGTRDQGFAECAAVLPRDDPRYIAFDFEAQKSDGSKLVKCVFISYSPDDCTSMQKKFALQNFKGSVKSKLNVQKEMQINDHNDFNENTFRQAFNL